MYNLYFYYKNYNRYIHFLKYSKNKYNYRNMLYFEKLSLSFNIKDLTDINNQSILSCIFFFKYYFGIVPFFYNYKYIFKLNINYFNFLIEYNFVDKLLYAPLFYFINDIYYMINKMHISCIKFKNYWEYTIHDMNFFLEKKNSLGFFNLKHKLVIQLYYSNKSNWNFNLFDTYKIKLK